MSEHTYIHWPTKIYGYDTNHGGNMKAEDQIANGNVARFQYNDLQLQINRVRAALETLLDELTGYPNIPDAVEIAAGMAKNKLWGK